MPTSDLSVKMSYYPFLLMLVMYLSFVLMFLEVKELLIINQYYINLFFFCSQQWYVKVSNNYFIRRKAPAPPPCRVVLHTISEAQVYATVLALCLRQPRECVKSYTELY